MLTNSEVKSGASRCGGPFGHSSCAGAPTRWKSAGISLQYSGLVCVEATYWRDQRLTNLDSSGVDALLSHFT